MEAYVTDPDDELSLMRLETLGARLASGDETDLISIESDDLGLPGSTSSVEILRVRYEGSLEEIAREPRAAGEVMVEYDFRLCVDIEATMAANDASPNGSGHEELESELVVTRVPVNMTARTGVVYQGTEVLGFIEYIGVRRTDGTPASPVGMLNGDARVYKFPLPLSYSERPAD